MIPYLKKPTLIVKNKMHLPFREHHLFKLFSLYEKRNSPIDYTVSLYFKQNKALGSKDRKKISEILYSLVRWRGLLDYLIPSGSPRNWEHRLEAYKKHSLTDYLQQDHIPLHIRLSFPKQLFSLLEKDYGIQDTINLCLALNKEAPLTIRANTLKISRQDLLKKWESKYSLTPCTQSFNGILFSKREALFKTEEFKKGFFEIQDEGSQLIAQFVNCKPKDHVLDYCSGSGGKTLAFAPNMKQQGQIYLHDIRPHALTAASKRLKRAGIQNAQILGPEHAQLKTLKKRMNWVLADVPCSGTGTLKRNPDMKWKFTEEALMRLVEEQRDIFDKALSFLRSDGKIVYATCSLLQIENEHQIRYFMEKYSLKLIGSYLKTSPYDSQIDGFFAAVLACQ